MSRKPGIYLKVDQSPRGLQVSIYEVEEDGRGHGFRITGPKYDGTSKNLKSVQLGKFDAKEIRRFLDKVEETES